MRGDQAELRNQQREARECPLFEQEHPKEAGPLGRSGSAVAARLQEGTANFAQTHARTQDPKTSKASAIQAESFASTHCQAIYGALLEHGPMGKTRIAARTQIDHVAVARRLADLQQRGLAIPTGQTEASGSGRQERTWRAL